MSAAIVLGPAIAAIVKCLIWALGIGYAIAFRRALFTAGATLATATGIVRGINDSGGHVPLWLLQGVVYWTTPTAALIVAGFVVGRYDPVWITRAWRL